MKKINLIMPMAGGGVRFKDHDFLMPKPLIQIFGKPFFYWAAMSVLKCTEVGKLIFVVLEEHEKNFGISEVIHGYFPEAEIVVIPHILNGAVLTALEGVKPAEEDVPVVFNDCDHIFGSDSFGKFCGKGDFDEPEGMILTFKSGEDKFSYIKYSPDGSFCGTVEKSVVSSDAICGVYYFKNKSVFEKAAGDYLLECSYKEFFISGVYNSLFKAGGSVKSIPVDFHVSFGTPDEYVQAQSDRSYFEVLDNGID